MEDLKQIGVLLLWDKKMINIFLIPSWYPNKLNPLAGSFTKEQSLLISKYSKTSFTVSIADEYFLTPRNIFASFRNLFQYLKAIFS